MRAILTEQKQKNYPAKSKDFGFKAQILTTPFVRHKEFNYISIMENAYGLGMKANGLIHAKQWASK